MDKFYNTKEAATLLGLSPVHVRTLCEQGRLGSKVGRDWIITQEELDAFERRPRGRPPKEKEPPH
jgi:excisionase family DNA binding protein